MQNKSKIIRNIIIFLIVFILAIVGYRMFFGKKQSTPALKTTTPAGIPASSTKSTGNSTVGADFLALLTSIQTIELDDSIFSSKAFLVLQDFNRPIPEDTNPGRPNPFAPIGADSAIVSSQVSTSNPSSITGTMTILNGTLAVGGQSTSRWFEYGTTTALGTMTAPKTQQNPGAFAETIDKLIPNTTYYAKAGATINGVVVGGNIVTWKTAQK